MDGPAPAQPGNRGPALSGSEGGDEVLRGERAALLPLATFLELKLASGMSAPHRLKDLADVIEVVCILQLAEELSGELEPSVREKYRELWQAAQAADRE